MTEQLVSFDTAKLAKEKGFNISSKIRYDEKYPLSDALKFINSLNWNEGINGIPKGYISVPTQSLLQKWLREVHNIHVTPVISDVKTGIYLCNIKWWRKHYIEQNSGSGTYEEALEIGLQEALKLI